ncbi:PepSY domain-containing protein [Allopontixanthobacter sp.]|uniref:PepSY domain-containing protein n=1 Tax=Allopontixanthobacter sp. TaxID=2906452 RepID=UPI002ABB1FCB|nr:PepSY domain-containing protein [Allopontixanthobacter sp.]MDZ4307763.1 PepSY domain-containing protein [Allopontixanthobacter sp.]
MARQKWMLRFARWHIWLGWLVGVPVVMWMVTGLVMVARPIDEVRGNHLRIEQPESPLPPDTAISVALPDDPARPVKSVTTAMQSDQPVTTIEYMDGALERFGSSGARLPPLNEIEARVVVAEQIVGGDRIASITAFDADNVPFDFRRPLAVWQVELDSGDRIYIGRDTGQIEAVRTRWWRLFDFMWGLHIMDLQTREDTSHPILILFAALGLIGALLGTMLMFRRRKARPRA